MSNRFAIIFGALVTIFIGMLVFSGNGNAPADENGGQLTSHVSGQGNANVTLIEYGDFECPACYRFYPIIEEVREKYEEEITFQFRHFPLVEIHQNALAASRAAEAAGKQDGFWDMYNLLYQNQPAWSQSSNPLSAFEGYAEQIGLDVERYKEDFRSEEVNRAVQADRNEARRLGYSSTPTFELNGEQLTDVQGTVEYFTEIIDAAIAESQNDQESSDSEEPAVRPEEDEDNEE